MISSPLPEELEDARPTVKHLYRLLELGDSDTAYQHELVEMSGHARKTVKQAMETLIDEGVVEHATPRDARRVRYRLVSPEE